MTNYITKEGLKELNDELKNIIEVKLPQVLDAINKALKEGDLSENAALDSSKLERDNLVAREGEIRDILKGYEIIEESSAKGSKTIKIGSHVKIQYSQDNSVFDLFIVGSSESDATAGKISNESPLAEAILGKKEGDKAQVTLNNNVVEVVIKEILA
ncbi:transcription elongation factor GreA [Candidatus Gracilibacteria bacterium]|nr:transcription elongation factor GreA [Candidatus Gracilibacteria bacterium]NJS41366.1 transcription elongation factor GreA [Candidatus Gracilibacteria bacterium]